jgi:hypothetical protein
VCKFSNNSTSRHLSRSNPYLEQFFATRQRLKIGLTIAGVVGGGIVGAVLTILGKLVAGAPPATIYNYAWNVVIFGLTGAVIGPTVIWSGLRRVPLWRTVVEPLAAGVGAAALGVVLGSGVAFLVLPPVAIVAATARLRYTYQEKRSAIANGDV